MERQIVDIITKIASTW